MVIEKQILLFINIVHNGIKQYISDFFQESGLNLTPEQFLVMDTLWDEGVLSQQQIADITMRDKNSIVKLIDGLENRNLVKRVSNPMDRRQNLIEVTEYSRSIQEHATIISYQAAAKILKDISSEAAEMLVKTISAIEKNINPKSDLLAMAEKYPTKKNS